MFLAVLRRGGDIKPFGWKLVSKKKDKENTEIVSQQLDLHLKQIIF